MCFGVYLVAIFVFERTVMEMLAQRHWSNRTSQMSSSVCFSLHDLIIFLLYSQLSSKGLEIVMCHLY